MEVGLDAGGKRGLRGFHRAGVFQPRVAEHRVVELLREPFARRGRRRPIGAAFPQRPVDVERPELVREPHARQHVQNQVRKDHVQVEPELGAARRVHVRGQRVLGRGALGDGLAEAVRHGRGRARLVLRVAVHDARAVRAVQPHFGQMAQRVVLAGERVRVGSPVDGVDVIALGKRVQGDLPIAAQLGPIRVARRQVGVGKAAQALAQFTEVGFQRLRRFRMQVDEDETLPGLGRDAREPVVGFVEMMEEPFVGHADQLAVGVVHPAVEFARKMLAVPGGLPRQRVPAVRTDVVEAAQDAVLPADQQHGRAADVHAAHQIIAGPRHLFVAADVQPDRAEHALALQREIGGRNARLGRHRFGAQLGVCLGPTLVQVEDRLRHAPSLRMCRLMPRTPARGWPFRLLRPSSA